MEKLIQELDKERAHRAMYQASAYDCGRISGFDDALYIVRNHNPWIPASEGLPPSVKDVNETSLGRYYDYLVRDKHKNHWIAFHIEGRWYDRSDDCFIDDITDYQHIYLEPTKAANDGGAE